MAEDAGVLAVNNTGEDPVRAAAEHARKIADQLAEELKVQEKEATAAKKAIDANLKNARQMAADAEAEASRCEALVED